jgi:hypothetical protein
MGHNKADAVRSVRPLGVKNADEYKKILFKKLLHQCQDYFLTLMKRKRIGILYE